MTLTFCLAEDREPEEVGLRLALLSLKRNCPSSRVFIYRPNPSADFTSWLEAFPMVTLIPALPPGAYSWNCKPNALLPLLEQGFSEVIWLDSDILVARPCADLLAGVQEDTLVIAQEQVSSLGQGTKQRTEGWGLPLGHSYPMTLNTCVLRVTAHHVPLLARWRQLLGDDRYVGWQKRLLSERPLAFMSDQDVLNALLGSEEFACLPIRILKTGLDVIHSGGALAYSLSERLRGLVRPIPPFVHGQGAKPWMMFDPAAQLTGRFWFYRRLLQEVSPYVALARGFRQDLAVPCPWMDCWSPTGLLVRGLGLGHFALRGLPLTTVATVIQALRPAA